MIGETQERFLRAIAAQLAPERVEEVHLFPAIRQGGVESGVAVIAVQPDEGPASEPADAGAEVETDAPPAVHRLTVYQAHYRLVLKGVDRGAWEVSVAAEADAPLDAVDAVVRGVHRRAGEDAEPERLGGDAFRAALMNEPWTAAR